MNKRSLGHFYSEMKSDFISLILIYQISLICFQQNVCLVSKTNVGFETLVAPAKRFYLTVFGKSIIITRLTPVYLYLDAYRLIEKSGQRVNVLQVIRNRHFTFRW